ncbi:invasion associated locus B family protein [Pseudogemmobacter sonorensis]|uniref:invasion associated locus B family protein n=1 Tax=Pseudogemmobacter sonorensis TaxID=2989681 RepID=UPI003686B7C8
MLKSGISILALLLALGAGLPAAAQEAEAPAEAPADAPEATADVTNVPGGLALGVEEGTPLGTTYEKERFGDWAVSCVNTDLPEDFCELQIVLRDVEGNSTARFTLINLPEGTAGPAVAGGTIITPLETLLSENIRLSIDGSNALIYPFTFCQPAACVARIGFTADEITRLKRGSKATVSIVPLVAPDQNAVLEFSLSGFTAGYDAMVAQNLLSDAAATEAAAAAAAAGE